MTLRTTARGAQIYALDGKGARVKEVASQLGNGQLKWSVGPQYRTLWYEIALQP